MKLRSSWSIHRTLDGYIGRRAGAIFAANVVVFAMVYALVDSLNQMDSFVDSAPDLVGLFGVAATYYYYQLPGLFCQILGPVTTMATGMFTVTLTARANEFVPILATGTSVRRTLCPLLVLALAAGAGVFWLQESWIPSHRGDIRKAQAFGRGHGEIRNAFYADATSGTRVAMRTYFPSEQRAEGVLVIERHGGGERLTTAAAARWRQAQPGAVGQWVLEDGETFEYGPEGNLVPVPLPPAPEPAPEPSAPPASATPEDERPRFVPTTSLGKRFESRVLESGMIPQDLEGADSQDGFLRLDELRRKAELAPDRHRWRIRYYSRLANPLHHLILILIGVPTLFLRGIRNVFLSAILAVAIATTYFVFQAVAVYLGNEEILSPALAAWIGPIVFFALGATLWRGMRS